MLWCDVALRFVTPVQPLEGEGGKQLSHRRVALRYLHPRTRTAATRTRSRTLTQT